MRRFLQWIDCPEKWNRQILLFLYDSRYKSVSIIWHLWFELFDFRKHFSQHLNRLRFFKTRICADSCSGSIALRSGTDKFFFSCMIELSHLRTTLSSVGFPRHQIHLEWHMRRTKSLHIMFATHLCANMGTVRNWWTRLWGITLLFGVVLFLYR
jgi:hypothetical protein